MKERTLLEFSPDGLIATITINNFRHVQLTKGLQQINTLDQELFQEIAGRLDEINRSAAKGVVFTGIHPEGHYPVFCDGIDLTFLAGLKLLDFGDDMRREVTNHMVGIEVLNRIARMRQYFIGRINGACLGGGLELALGLDCLIALPNLLVGFPEAKFGILPGWNGLQTLVYKIGKKAAFELFFEGFFKPLSYKHPFKNGIVTSQEARRLGIIDEIVPSLWAMDRRIVEIVTEFADGVQFRRPKPELRPYKMFPEK